MGVIEGKRFQTEFFSDLFGFLVSISEFLHYWLRLNFFQHIPKVCFKRVVERYVCISYVVPFWWL